MVPESVGFDEAQGKAKCYLTGNISTARVQYQLHAAGFDKVNLYVTNLRRTIAVIAGGVDPPLAIESRQPSPAAVAGIRAADITPPMTAPADRWQLALDPGPTFASFPFTHLIPKSQTGTIRTVHFASAETGPRYSSRPSGANQRVDVVDLKARSVLATGLLPLGDVLAVSPSGAHFAFAPGLKDQVLVFEFDRTNMLELVAIDPPPLQRFSKTAIFVSESRVVLGNSLGLSADYLFYDLPRGNLAGKLADAGDYQELALSRGRKYLAVARKYSKGLEIVDTGTLQRVGAPPLRDLPGSLSSVAFTPDGTKLLIHYASYGDTWLAARDMQTGQPLWQMKLRNVTGGSSLIRCISDRFALHQTTGFVSLIDLAHQQNAWEYVMKDPARSLIQSHIAPDPAGRLWYEQHSWDVGAPEGFYGLVVPAPQELTQIDARLAVLPAVLKAGDKVKLEVTLSQPSPRLVSSSG